MACCSRQTQPESPATIGHPQSYNGPNKHRKSQKTMENSCKSRPKFRVSLAKCRRTELSHCCPAALRILSPAWCCVSGGFCSSPAPQLPTAYSALCPLLQKTFPLCELNLSGS